MPDYGPTWKSLPLWSNQKAAIKTCLRYLLKEPSGDALVQMPTGTGKTGVIAVLSSLSSSSGVVIVLTPSSALADQLRTDIRAGFWAALKLPKEELSHWAPGMIEELLPSRAAALQGILAANDQTRKVFVGTLQALQQIRREQGPLYEVLKTKSSLLIVDEGHREPAPEWADAVRMLKRPTILFTATPYRNDLKLFDVAADRFIYYLSFNEAVNEKLIRPVVIMDAALPVQMDLFASQLIAHVDGLKKKKEIRPDAKVIVRCASESSVSGVSNAIRQALGSRKDGVLAVHDTFDGSIDGQVKHVPNIRKSNSVFLVHQFKLMEGIDEPRCSVLALYEEFENDRQLVQQIGRIVRHDSPGKTMATPAVVMACLPNRIQAAWDRYREFDEICEKNGRPIIRRPAAIIDKLQAAFPKAEYIDRRFRMRVDFDNEDLWEELLIQKSCVIYRKADGFAIPKIMDEIRFLLGVEDRFIVTDKWSVPLKCHYILSVEFRQSELLAYSTFSEPRLTATIVKPIGDFLFFHDTAGLWVDEVLDGARRLDALWLRCLFPENRGTRISSLSVKNSEIGNFALLSRTLTANSLADSAPFLGDYSNFITRAAGTARLKNDLASRRYVGFTRGRVRDSASFVDDDDDMIGTIADFSAWVDALASELVKRDKAVDFFGRFAAPIPPPLDPTPVSILIDAQEFSDVFARGNKKILIDDACCEVLPIPDATGDFRHGFELSTNGKQHRVEIRFDSKSSQYKLRSQALDAYLELPKRRVTLTDRLNQKQSFRIVTRSSTSIYASGQFYDTSLSLKGGVGTFLLDLLYPCESLATIEDEKGSGIRGYGTWKVGSLFRFIDDEIRSKKDGAPTELGRRFSAVVCDDPQPECADFIGIDKKRGEVVFVHAKASDGDERLGASKLYEVCGQAIKNLAYLRMGNESLPSKNEKWEEPWSVDKTGYSVTPRIRCGSKNGDEFRKQLFELLRRPTTVRETWLVLGKTLSKTAMEKAIRANNPPAALLQSFYLLSSTYSQCKSVGVDLKVFCSK